MAKPRLPPEKAAVIGAAAKNPGRHEGRKAVKSAGLGPPSGWLKQFDRKAFELFRAELPWLKESDRVLVEIASTLRGRLLDPEDFLPLNGMQELRRCLASMGATPADQSRVTVAGDQEEDPDDALFQGVAKH